MMVGRWSFMAGLLAVVLTVGIKEEPNVLAVMGLIGAWSLAEMADKRAAKGEREALEDAIVARVAVQLQQLSTPTSPEVMGVVGRIETQLESVQEAIEELRDALLSELNELRMDVGGDDTVASKLDEVTRALEALEARVGDLEPEEYAEAS